MEGSSTNIVCDKCGKAFRSRTNLYDHTKRHLGQGPYKCCGKTFYSRANLKRHRCSVHNEEKTEKCHLCSYSCATKCDLKKHAKIHDPPEFKCDVCGGAYINKQDLKDHMDSHTDVKSHRCDCGKAYRYRSGLCRHKSKCSKT